MAGFFVFAIVFVAVLTAGVRLARLRVRRELPREQALLLTAAFVGLLLAAWWLLTRGATIEDRVLAPMILPSPVEVLQSLPGMHVEQG